MSEDEAADVRRESGTSRPMARGVVLALGAAVAFGATTPMVKLFSAGAGAFPTAMLLYAGSTVAALGRAGVPREAPVRRGHARRLVTVAVIGAVIAPVCLAWGLASTGGAVSSLLLNFEVAFTALLGWRLYREHLGRRFVLALLFMLAGSACLVLSRERGAGSVGWGAIAIVGAALAWAVDSALTRPLADLDPVDVTRYKGGIGAALTLGIALASGATFPRTPDMAGLVACGVIGYGVSLRFYLGAQRLIGAGRSAVVFGLAPFVGAAVAWAMGDRTGGLMTVAAAVLFAAGVLLQATEKHGHWHEHEAMEHEHLHRHDDGHHDHLHDPAFVGEHSHAHRHEAVAHEHPHAADLHHQHH